MGGAWIVARTITIQKNGPGRVGMECGGSGSGFPVERTGSERYGTFGWTV